MFVNECAARSTNKYKCGLCALYSVWRRTSHDSLSGRYLFVAIHCQSKSSRCVHRKLNTQSILFYLFNQNILECIASKREMPIRLRIQKLRRTVNLRTHTFIFTLFFCSVHRFPFPLQWNQTEFDWNFILISICSQFCASFMEIKLAFSCAVWIKYIKIDHFTSRHAHTLILRRRLAIKFVCENFATLLSMFRCCCLHVVTCAILSCFHFASNRTQMRNQNEIKNVLFANTIIKTRTLVHPTSFIIYTHLVFCTRRWGLVRSIYGASLALLQVTSQMNTPYKAKVDTKKISVHTTAQAHWKDAINYLECNGKIELQMSSLFAACPAGLSPHELCSKSYEEARNRNENRCGF